MDKSISAVDRAVQTISDNIATGRFRTGQRLPEVDLVEQLGVSKNVLREAFARLQQDGVIEVQRFRGAMVRRLTLEEVETILAVNSLLFAWGMREAAMKIDKSREGRKRLAQMRDILRSLQPRNQREHLDAFYEMYYLAMELADNSYLSSLLKPGMDSLLKEFIIETIPLGENVVEHTREVADVLELVEQGQGDAAFEAMRAWAKIDRAWLNPVSLKSRSQKVAAVRGRPKTQT